MLSWLHASRGRSPARSQVFVQNVIVMAYLSNAVTIGILQPPCQKDDSGLTDWSIWDYGQERWAGICHEMSSFPDK